ncbi:MAG: alpha/beta fold hydrolase [Deltaproteobacteria bacterium]|nr:alpha/beta fold hydrolase [Deltaproteobacteria bacterium]
MSGALQTRQWALLRRARILARRRMRRAGRFVSMLFEAVGDAGEVWRPMRRDDFGQGTGRPVLLLHGFGAPRRILNVLERRLRRELGVSVMSFHLPGLGGALGGQEMVTEAARLAEKLERLCQRHGVTELDIIGHSKGGLVARWMVSHHNVGRRVRTLVALGTPYAGAPLAVLGVAAVGLFSRSVWQLLPFSQFMRRLRATPVPEGTRMVSISGGVDVIAPAPLCRVDARDAAPGMWSNHIVAGVGHNSLLMSRRVLAIIRKELRGVPQSAARESA